MAFNAAVKLTNAGKEMLAQGQLGTPLRFTRFVMGSGNTALPPEAMTDVVTPVLNLPIKQKIDRGGGEIYIRTDYTNQVITEAFYYRELGIYADQQPNEDDPVTNERLYCYGNAGAVAELIQPQTGTSTLEKIVGLTIGIGNATTVILNIDPSIAYVTTTEFAAHKHTGNDGTEQISFGDLDEVPDEVTILGPKQQAQDAAIAALEASQQTQDAAISALQTNAATSGLLSIPATGWAAISGTSSQEYQDGARYYRDVTLSGARTTDKVHGELVPETREIARDAGMLDYTRVVNAGTVRVYAESVPAGAISLQVTRMPASAGSKPVGYIAGLQAGEDFITYTAEQVGGTSGTVDSTGIKITFSKPITGLTASSITISNTSGVVSKGSLSGDGDTWTISIDATAQGDVMVAVASFGEYAFLQSGVVVSVYARPRVTFTVQQIGGSSSTTTTTGLKLVFSEPVSGLISNAITIINGTGKAVKGALSGSGVNWTLAISSVEEGTISVSIANFGNFVVTSAAQMVTVYSFDKILYNAGDEKNAITGGWTLATGEAGMISKLVDRMRISTSVDGAGFISIFTAKALSLAGCSQINFLVSTVGTTAGARDASVGVKTSRPTSTDNTYQVRYNITTALTQQTLSANISSINAAYAGFNLWRGNSGTTLSTIEVFKVWLS